jgi:hypothetical protein
MKKMLLENAFGIMTRFMVAKIKVGTSKILDCQDLGHQCVIPRF